MYAWINVLMYRNEKDMLSAAPTITIMFMKAFVLSECMCFYGIVMSIAALKQFSICYCHLCWCILFQDSFCIGNETSPWLYRFRSNMTRTITRAVGSGTSGEHGLSSMIWHIWRAWSEQPMTFLEYMVWAV